MDTYRLGIPVFRISQCSFAVSMRAQFMGSFGTCCGTSQQVEGGREATLLRTRGWLEIEPLATCGGSAIAAAKSRVRVARMVLRFMVKVRLTEVMMIRGREQDAELEWRWRCA
jgi:hypothetical protein